MGLVSTYAKFLRKTYRMHAVWPPLASRIDLGDYGVFHEGAFVRLGNVAEFGAAVESHDTPGIELKARSHGVSFARFQAGAPVNAFAPLEVDARLEVKFDHDESFFLNAEVLTARQARHPAAIAHALHDKQDWRRKYRVVSKLYSGTNVTVLAASRKGTALNIEAKAATLAALEQQWEFSTHLKIQRTTDLALEMHGKAGPVGVELFAVGFFGGAVPKSIGVPPGLVVAETDWDGDPADDF